MFEFLRGKLVIVLLTVISVALATWWFLDWRGRTRVYNVTLAAGSRTGESYLLGQAIKAVVARHRPNIRIDVLETGGTAESLALLESGKVALAAAQADVPVGSAARLIAVLYLDTFQLLVHKGLGIRSIVDLRGRRVGLPKAGGQYQSFLVVAEHFGMTAADYQFVGGNDEEADRAFLSNRADAVFRVRAVGNPAIASLVRTGDAEFVPIPQAQAMQIRLAAFTPAVIPQGAYLGAPPIPAADLESVGVHRTLLAHRDASDDVVRAVTEVLIEERQELADAIPGDRPEVRSLLAGVKPPDTPRGLGPPVHDGAQAYYDRDKPAFVEEYADFVALSLTVLLLLGSWMWELRRWVVQGQKDRADDYTHEVILLITRIQETAGAADREAIRRELLKLLNDVVWALDQERISEDSFQSFRVVWQIAFDLLREHDRTSTGDAPRPALAFARE